MAYDTPSFRFFIVLFIGSCHGLMTTLFLYRTVFSVKANYNKKESAWWIFE